MFAPYFMAPKLFAFAGSAVSGIVKGVDNAKSGFKERGGKLRNTETGKRLETNARAGLARKVNTRYGSGGAASGGFIGRRVAGSKMGTRMQARALEGQRKQGDIDTEAANVLINDQVNRVKSQELAAGKSKEEVDAAVTLHLKKILEDGSGSDETRRAAANRLVVDNQFGVIEEAVSKLKSSNSAKDQTLADSIIQDNLSAYSSKGDMVYKGVHGAAQGMTAETLAGYHPKALEHMMASIGEDLASGDAERVSSANASLANLQAQYATLNSTSDLKGKFGSKNHKLLTDSASGTFPPKT
jgi:hypothetical protein